MTRPVALSLIAAALILLTIAVVALWLATEAATDMPALRDEVDRYRSEVAKLTETLYQALHPTPVVAEPATQPITVVRTDTAPQDAVMEQGLAAITAEVAHYGRHAHRMPRGVR